MKTPLARLIQMKEYHDRTRTPERKKLLAERSSRWYTTHPDAGKKGTKKWRKNNPEAYRASRERSVARIRRLFIEAKDKPCADCGTLYASYIMDLDHIRGTKLFNISRGYSRGLKAVVAEIAKCEAVCSNCHRERTHQRKQK